MAEIINARQQPLVPLNNDFYSVMAYGIKKYKKQNYQSDQIYKPITFDSIAS